MNVLTCTIVQVLPPLFCLFYHAWLLSRWIQGRLKARIFPLDTTYSVVVLLEQDPVMVLVGSNTPSETMEMHFVAKSMGFQFGGNASGSNGFVPYPYCGTVTLQGARIGMIKELSRLSRLL